MMDIQRTDTCRAPGSEPGFPAGEEGAYPPSDGAMKPTLNPVEPDHEGGPAPRDPLPPWLFWDGDCRFCARWVAWLRSRDGDRFYRILPYQQAPDPPLTPELRSRATRSVLIVFEDGRRLEGGRAILHVLGATGHPRWAKLLARPPARWAVEGAYRAAARYRGILSRFLPGGSGPGCGIPPPPPGPEG